MAWGYGHHHFARFVTSHFELIVPTCPPGINSMQHDKAQTSHPLIRVTIIGWVTPQSMGSQADSSSEFVSPSFDLALAELAIPEMDVPMPVPPASVRFSDKVDAGPTPSPDWNWPDEEELAALDEFEAGRSLKRKRKQDSVDPADIAKDEVRVEGSSSIGKDITQVDPMYEEHPGSYVASKFGGIGAYLRHKREKLYVYTSCWDYEVVN